MSTSRARKPSYHHGDLAAALRQVGGQILEKEGVPAITLREVARRAGVSHNAPYRHFPDREALLAALAAEGFHELAADLAAAPRADMGEAYVAFALRRPQRFRLMFGPLALADHPALKEAAAVAYQPLLDAFRARGDLPDPESAAAAAWSLVHGLAHLLLDGHLASSAIKRVLGAVRFAGVSSAPGRR
jgi:AcrR family transcriptional regulator